MAWDSQSFLPLDEELFQRWVHLLELRTGITFGAHRHILQRALIERLRALGLNSYQDYYHLIQKGTAGAAEWRRLVDQVSVKETSFFRHPPSYRLAARYLRQRLTQTSGSRCLDLWSVGCSTGEEAYSLAILVQELFDQTGTNRYWGILASDISFSALQRARQGAFSRARLQAIEPYWQHKYFTLGLDEGVAVPSLRQRICFMQDNLMALSAMPSQSMDLVFCQNVLIYFSRERQVQVLDQLAQRLKPGGMLIVGPGEAPHWQHADLVRWQGDGAQAFLRWP